MSLQSNIMLEILRYAQDDTGEKLKIENGKLKINFAFCIFYSALCILHFPFPLPPIQAEREQEYKDFRLVLLLSFSSVEWCFSYNPNSFLKKPSRF